MPAAGESDYRPERYWSKRLARDFNLKGTGHIAYSEAYNRWLYRAKRRALSRALALTGGPGRALDIGSGTGWVVNELVERGYDVDGVDVTSVAVERLRASFPALLFHQVEAGSSPLPSPDASVDLVTAFDVLYHVVDDERWTAALGEIGRVLAPGGHLIVTDTLGDEDRHDAAHVKFRSAAAWRASAPRAGLELLSCVPLYRWLSRPRSGPLRRTPDWIRGPVEFGLEYLAPKEPHLRCAVLRSNRAPSRRLTSGEP